MQLIIAAATYPCMARELVSVTCEGQQRVAAMWLVWMIIVRKKQGKGSCVWKAGEDSCGAVKAGEARDDVPCGYCLCQFELWRDGSHCPIRFLFLLNFNMSEEKGHIYYFQSRTKSSSFLCCLLGNEYSCIEIFLLFTGTVFLRSSVLPEFLSALQVLDPGVYL